jgi:hypothetical protein
MANKTLDRMTRSASGLIFQDEGAWRAPRHRSAYVGLMRTNLMFQFIGSILDGLLMAGIGHRPGVPERSSC